MLSAGKRDIIGNELILQFIFRQNRRIFQKFCHDKLEKDDELFGHWQLNEISALTQQLQTKTPGTWWETVVKHEWRLPAANSISPTDKIYSDKSLDLLSSSVNKIKTAI